MPIAINNSDDGSGTPATLDPPPGDVVKLDAADRPLVQPIRRHQVNIQTVHDVVGVGIAKRRAAGLQPMGCDQVDIETVHNAVVVRVPRDRLHDSRSEVSEAKRRVRKRCEVRAAGVRGGIHDLPVWLVFQKGLPELGSPLGSVLKSRANEELPPSVRLLPTVTLSKFTPGLLVESAPRFHTICEPAERSRPPWIASAPTPGVVGK